MKRMLSFILLILLIASILLSGNKVNKTEDWDYVEPQETQRV